MRLKHSALVGSAFLTACGAQQLGAAPAEERRELDSGPAPDRAGIQPPRGAVLEPSGFATILSAPPVPYPDVVPPDPYADQPRPSDANPYAMMNPDQDTMRAAIQLLARLRTEARGNYVDAMVIRDPKPRYVFYFRRNAAATLARFTSDPRFEAREGGVPAEELEPLFQEWHRRFAKRRLSSTGSLRTFEGDVQINLGVSQAEYEKIAAEEGWPKPPPNVRLTFVQPVDNASAVSPDAAPFVRVFARQDRNPGVVLTVAISGRIILRDGCLRVDRGEAGQPLALFGREAKLGRDAEGYLVVRSPDAPGDLEKSARVGEIMTWGGYPAPVENEPGVKALRAQCGGGPIVSVGLPESSHKFRVRPWAITAYAVNKGLTRQAAWDEIRRCWAEEDAKARAARPGEARRPPRECDSPFPYGAPPVPPAPPPPPPPPPPPTRFR